VIHTCRLERRVVGWIKTEQIESLDVSGLIVNLDPNGLHPSTSEMGTEEFDTFAIAQDRGRNLQSLFLLVFQSLQKRTLTRIRVVVCRQPP